MLTPPSSHSPQSRPALWPTQTPAEAQHVCQKGDMTLSIPASPSMGSTQHPGCYACHTYARMQAKLSRQLCTTLCPGVCSFHGQEQQLVFALPAQLNGWAADELKLPHMELAQCNRHAARERCMLASRALSQAPQRERQAMQGADRRISA